MSEYADAGAAARLAEAAGGGPSEFVKRMRQQPFAVVLLDEIEKASPAVFDGLMSVFDEGRLTDPYGRVTTFRSAVIVMTSNIGEERIRISGFGEERPPSYEAETMAFFRPEFFNRLDAVVTFNPLDEAMIAAITRKELGEIARREGLARAGPRFDWTERLARRVAREGFDPRYGARPLQRKLDELVVAPLARFLLEWPGLEGATVLADMDEEGVVRFEV
jgi:ATP-dependent Clp protease ATP-binding subunit ClpC